MRHLISPRLTQGLAIAGLAVGLLVGGCTSTPPLEGALSALRAEARAERLQSIAHKDLLLLGEQHDGPGHQAIEAQVVEDLGHAGRLAAVVLEMAPAATDTRGLDRDAPPAQVMAALRWADEAWPWQDYGPAVMAAVRMGIPVAGGNLTRTQVHEAMQDASWDYRIPAAAWQLQQTAVREGHCNLLPAAQIAAMTRVQLARDASLAATAAQWVRPGQTVLVITGDQHSRKDVGLPLHLPVQLTVQAVRLAADGPRSSDAAAFDAVWSTDPAPETDHCAALRQHLVKP